MPGEMSLSMRAVFAHNPRSLEVLYSGKDDILYTSCDSTGVHSLISVICDFDSNYSFKPMLLRILADAKKYDLSIELPVQEGVNTRGICHSACKYCDKEVAREILSWKGVMLHRVDEDGETGPCKLAEISKANKQREAVDILAILLECGYDVNYRFNDESPTLLERFMTAVNKNYDAIKYLIDHGADLNVKYSRKDMKLLEFPGISKDRKLMKLLKND